MKINYIIKLLFSFVVLFQSLPNVAGERQTDSEYTFGVFPYLSKKLMHNIYAPLNDRVNSILTNHSSFTTELSHRNFIHKLNNEIYDFALIPPFWYPVAVDKKNYIAELKVKEPFSALIVTLEDSPIESADDLRGKVIATPPIFVPVVSLSVSALIQQGIVPGVDVTFSENETVDACLRKVVDKKVSACITPSYIPFILGSEFNVKFKTILKSSNIPSVSLVIHSRVNQIDRDKLINMFSSLSETVGGRELLKNMQTEGFVTFNDDEYDVVRQLVRKSRLMH